MERLEFILTVLAFAFGALGATTCLFRFIGYWLYLGDKAMQKQDRDARIVRRHPWVAWLVVTLVCWAWLFHSWGYCQ